MVSATVEGIERAIFGEVTADDVTAWLDRHVRRRLSPGMQTVLFRAGHSPNSSLSCDLPLN
ncbi:MAG: hypothetical protein ACYDER_09500 [Ktedonobacteraceae bacterium]